MSAELSVGEHWLPRRVVARPKPNLFFALFLGSHLFGRRFLCGYFLGSRLFRSSFFGRSLLSSRFFGGRFFLGARGIGVLRCSTITLTLALHVKFTALALNRFVILLTHGSELELFLKTEKPPRRRHEVNTHRRNLLAVQAEIIPSPAIKSCEIKACVTFTPKA